MAVPIRRIHNRIGATSVLVTHDQHEGMTLADRLVVMNKGTIEQVGTPAEIYDHPASVYVGGFIGSPAMNVLPGQIDAHHGDVVLESGARLRTATDMRGHGGRLVQVGLRPEQVSLVPEGQGDISARVDFIEELGASRLCHLRVEDLPFSVLTSAKPALGEGAPVAVSVAPQAIHLFDAESGRRIATEMARQPVRETV